MRTILVAHPTLARFATQVSTDLHWCDLTSDHIGVGSNTKFDSHCQVQLSLDILPVEHATEMVGLGRSSPNRFPFLPQPVSQSTNASRVQSARDLVGH